MAIEPDQLADDPDYQLFLESMARFCHCDDGGPCDGVLAGGLCDEIHEEPNDGDDEWADERDWD